MSHPDFRESFGNPITFTVKPEGMGKRHIIAFMGFLSFALSYSMRFILSIAIVAMVKGPTLSDLKMESMTMSTDVCHHLNTDSPNNATFYKVEGLKINGSYIGKVVSVLEHPKPDVKQEEEGEFSWSESQQGLILGSFFWGYLITQIPGGWLGHRFGGKWPLGLGLFINAILTLLTPFAARIGGLYALVALRVTQGFAGGVTVPSMHALLARWFSPEERGQLTAFVYAGMSFGTALSLIVSGYLIHYFGWPMVFYVTGAATVIWFCFWTFLVYSDPSEHPHISEIELKYIQNSLLGDSESEASAKGKSPPWGKVLKSGPFWAIILGQLAETWGLYTIMTELPTYMKTVLHFDIEENSLLSAVPHLLTWTVGLIIPKIGDYFIRKRYFSIGTTRKMCNSIGMWGLAAALIGVAYSGCNRVVTVTLLSVGVALTGGILGGVLVNLIDIAPNYAGILMGITNSAGTIPGVLAPYVAGVIIDKDPSINRWRIVFLITSAISFTGNLLFLLLASGEEQPWNRIEKEENNQDSGNREIQLDDMQMDLTTFYVVPIKDAEDSYRTPEK